MTSEVADLIYHLLVLLVARGVSLDEIREELGKRRKAEALRRVKANLKSCSNSPSSLHAAQATSRCKYFRKKPETSTKSDGSYVTIADREAEAICANRSRTFPDDGILGEEEGESTGRSGRRWIVDPIDGTFAFVHGVPFYGVLIALEIEARDECWRREYSCAG